MHLKRKLSLNREIKFVEEIFLFKDAMNIFDVVDTTSIF